MSLGQGVDEGTEYLGSPGACKPDGPFTPKDCQKVCEINHGGRAETTRLMDKLKRELGAKGGEWLKCEIKGVCEE
jgi:hypothetical protein